MKYTILELDEEFQKAYNSNENYHGDMTDFLDYYMNSAFYAPRKGEPKSQNNLRINLLQTFADKNVHFTSKFPKISVSDGTSDDAGRMASDLREKIILATWDKSAGEIKQRKWSSDATLLTVAISEVCWDDKNSEVYIKRYDPRYCYWMRSNMNDDHLQAFYVAYPMSYEEVESRYGVKPTHGSGIDPFAFDDSGLMEELDGREWTMVITRLDDTTRAVWAGDAFIEKPHKHNVGINPIDICVPMPDPTQTLKGDFYLRPLIPLQAELNHAFRMRSNIIRKMGSPAVWARGLYARQLEEVKRALQGDGGLVGLKGQGELGILSPPETSMIDNHINDIILQMQRIAGYNSATFGESVGANASGDTYGMLFAPTTRSVGYQNQAWKAFYEAINSKILYLYDKKLTAGRKKSLKAYKPKSVFTGVNKENEPQYQKAGVYSIEFDRTVINGNYGSKAEFEDPAPQDELAKTRLWYEMAQAGQISKDTLYDKIGLQSPQDEIIKLESEQGNPILNPDGMSKLTQSATNYEKPATKGA